MLFSLDIGIDLGTANTLVFVKGKGIVIREPSVVAVDQKYNPPRVVAVGTEAKEMIGRTPGSITAVRPLKDGVIADFDITADMLKAFIKKVAKSAPLAKVRVMICIPSGVTGVERNAVNDAARSAGAKYVSLIEEPMAAAIGERLGLTAAEIAAGTAAYAPVGSRMHLIRMDGDRLVIDDCYNANPQAMEAALEILADTACRRRVAVLGDMGELGPISHDAHLEVGRVTARLGLDAVIAIGPKSAAIAETAGPRALHFDTVQQALPTLREQLTPGTAMLVKASHAMEFGKIVNELETTTYDRHQCDRSGQIL